MPRRSRPGGLAMALALALLAMCVTRGLMPNRWAVAALPPFSVSAPPTAAVLAALRRGAAFEGSAVRHRAAPVAAHVLGRPHESAWARWDATMHELWRWLTGARTRTGR